MEFHGGLVVKDSALSLLWLGLDPWPRNFCMLWVQPKKKKKKKKKLLMSPPLIMTDCILGSFVCFGPAHGMWKFPGQGLNLNHSSDNAESLTARPSENSRILILCSEKFALEFGRHHSLPGQTGQ